MPRIYTRQIRTRSLRPDWDYMYKEVAHTLDNRVKPDLVNYFQRIVSPWSDESRPTFRARKHITRDEIVVWVYPAGTEHAKNVWRWLSITGTKEHTIEATNAPWLQFRTEYQARTNLSGGWRGPGMAEGDWRKVQQVMHPGFDRRRFEWWVALWYKPKFYPLMEAAFKRGIRRAKAHARSM